MAAELITEQNNFEKSQEGLILRHSVAEVLLYSLILFLLAILNRFPFVFSDTGTYLLQIHDLGIWYDRFPYYSVFIHHMGGAFSLWIVALLQDVIVAYVLFRALRLFAPSLQFYLRLLSIIVAACLTGLPWVSNVIMPDIFAPVMVILVAIIVWKWAHLCALERVAMVALLFAVVLLHQGNVLLLGGLLVFSLAANLVLKTAKRNRAGLFAVAATLVASIPCLAYWGYQYSGRITLSSSGPFYVLSRLIADGPGREYLRHACKEPNALKLCAHESELPDDFNRLLDVFIWNSPPYGFNFLGHKEKYNPSEETYSHMVSKGINDANFVARETIKRYPLQVLETSSVNFALANIRFNADYGSGHYSTVENLVSKYVPGDLPALTGSRQSKGSWPYDSIFLIHKIVVTVAACVLFYILLISRKEAVAFDRMFVATVLFSIVLNAAIMGVLSGPFDRFGARMIWLIPLLAFVTVAAQWRHRRAEKRADNAAVDGVAAPATMTASGAREARP